MSPRKKVSQHFLSPRNVSPVDPQIHVQNIWANPPNMVVSLIFHPRDIHHSVTGSTNSLVLVHLIKLQAGRVSDIRVDRIISLNSLVLSHPRRGNAGHHSRLRHWNCWTHTLNGTHTPQVRRQKGPNEILIKYSILKLPQRTHLVRCILVYFNGHSVLSSVSCYMVSR
jgi:hypothetical protein